MSPFSPSPMRSILHVDMDAFFVAVEELENPSLKGKAVVVGADPDGRGVVAAASYAAREFGIHSALPIRTAKKLCPHAIFLRGRHEKYREYSQEIRRIFEEFTPAVRMASMDEAYLDLTGTERLHGGALRAADRLIRRVKERTHLDCSVGASTSHLVSKIASDQAKPHGLLAVFPGCEALFLAPLPIRRMPGVGKVTEPELLALGLATIGDVQRYGLERLRGRFGPYGEWLHRRSLGQDIGADAYDQEPKSISHETTFDADTSDPEEIERTLSYLAQLVGRRLRERRLFARTVGLKLRNGKFKTLTRDATLDEPTHLDSVIFENAMKMFRAAWDAKEDIRLLGVRASGLERQEFQLNLLEAERRRKLGRALAAADRVREKFGFDSIQMARSLEKEEEPKPRKRRRFWGRE